MIRLDSVQTLAAVRRSLRDHVLPAIGDDFARLQVLAALKALEDVCDRLERGDPLERSNQRLRDGLVDIAEQARATAGTNGTAGDAGDGAGVEDVEALVARADAETDVRTRAHVLRTGASALLGTGALAAQVLTLCNQEASMVSMEEAPWMCAEAIESLQ